MTLTRFISPLAIICATLTTGDDASAWGPERRKVSTPLTSVEIVDALRESHVKEFGRRPPRSRLAMAWAQVALENKRGAEVWGLNLGNIGPSQWSTSPWYFHAPKVRYRAFDNIEDAGRAYWRTVGRCYGALRGFDDGSASVAAVGLRRCGYYRADTTMYARGLNSLFNEALVEVVPDAERREKKIKENEREERELVELELRFPYTPTCGCSRWQ